MPHRDQNRRGGEAVSRGDRQAYLVSSLLTIYLHDPIFRSDLISVGQQQGCQSGREYAPDEEPIRTLAARWRLDRLPRDSGLDAIRDFYTDWDRDGAPPESFGPFFLIWGDDPDRSVLPVKIVEEELRPKRRLKTDGFEWHPYREPYTLARERLIAQLDERLHEIEDAWAQAGYTFVDGSPKHRTHLHWLYLRLVRRWSIRQITDWYVVADNVYSEQAISKATIQLARLLEIKLPPPLK